jgi:hypothetical protein
MPVRLNSRSSNPKRHCCCPAMLTVATADCVDYTQQFYVIQNVTYNCVAGVPHGMHNSCCCFARYLLIGSTTAHLQLRVSDTHASSSYLKSNTCVFIGHRREQTRSQLNASEHERRTAVQDLAAQPTWLAASTCCNKGAADDLQLQCDPPRSVTRCTVLKTKAMRRCLAHYYHGTSQELMYTPCIL